MISESYSNEIYDTKIIQLLNIWYQGYIVLKYIIWKSYNN